MSRIMVVSNSSAVSVAASACSFDWEPDITRQADFAIRSALCPCCAIKSIRSDPASCANADPAHRSMARKSRTQKPNVIALCSFIGRNIAAKP
jgi:hypothetical protein